MRRVRCAQDPVREWRVRGGDEELAAPGIVGLQGDQQGLLGHGLTGLVALVLVARRNGIGAGLR